MLASFLLSLFIISPIQVKAQEPEPFCPEEGVQGVDFLFFRGPLVPCGRQADCPDSEGNQHDETQVCTLCHLLILIKNVFDLILSLLIIVSLVMITAGGVIYVVSSGNANLKTVAKNLITKTLVGFGLFLLSWLIVLTVLHFLSTNTQMLGGGSNWFEFECQTQSAFEAPDSSGNSSDSSSDSSEDGEEGDDTENILH